MTLPGLRETIARIGPRLVIPMHYGTGRTNLPLAPLPDILEALAPLPVQYHPSPTITLSPDVLPAQTTVLVLPPAL